MFYASMLTRITQTLHMFRLFTYITHRMPTWLTHITFLIFLYLCWLRSPRPLYVFRFFTFITHDMLTWLTHTSITFLIFMHLCWLRSPRPLHVFRFLNYLTHCMLTWLTHTSYPLSLKVCWFSPYMLTRSMIIWYSHFWSVFAGANNRGFMKVRLVIHVTELFKPNNA